MSVTGLGTVTYNDGKHILAFGHPFFNLGPVDMPMSKGEVLMTLGSAVPAQQDSPMPPRSSARCTRTGTAASWACWARKLHGSGDRQGALLRRERMPCSEQKDLHFNVFVHQKWTPYLMMMTLFNSL